MDDFNDRGRAKASLQKPRGRMDTRGWGNTLYRYRTEAALDAIAQYNKLAKQAGMSLTEMSLRWCKERTLLTTTLVGHSNADQLEESLMYFGKDEPLSEDLLWEIDRVHMQNRLPLFSSNRGKSDALCRAGHDFMHFTHILLGTFTREKSWQGLVRRR